MSYKIVYRTIAIKEREEIIAWYEKQSRQATENFILASIEIVNKIGLTPFRYRNVINDYREIKMKKFPYYIIFRVDESKQQIVILRIYHASRNPKTKYRNIGG
ncbi:MAG: type II toxin-antitoxin system RelE/ParE family toxin [Ginsengibacter sp.]